LKQKKEIKALSDEELVRYIIKSKDSDAFGLIYDRFSEKVFRKCISLIKEQDLAKDLTHDIFLKIFMQLSKFQGKSSFSTWVYRISHNFCIDHLRKIQKQKFDSIDNIGDISDDDDEKNEELLFQIKANQLEKVLEHISVESKSLLLMKYQENSSIKEICEILELNEGTVKMRLKRAKASALQSHDDLFK